jgi:hypothetical protein
VPKRSASASVPEVLAGSVLPDLGSGVSPSQSKHREGGEVSRHGQPTPLCECGSPVEFCRCGELRCYLCDPIATDIEEARWDCDDWYFCETPIPRGGDTRARSHVELAQP